MSSTKIFRKAEAYPFGHDCSSELVESVVPTQRTGGQSNVELFCRCLNEPQAELVYEQLKRLLGNVNQWHSYINGASAHFQVTDESGRAIDKEPRVGYHFKIRIPGPPLTIGEGFDWITVCDRQELTLGDCSIFYIKAIPSPNPGKKSREVAHFLKKEASTTFIAVKRGRVVKMVIRSRNELPNVDVSYWKDRLRNRLVGLAAGIYLSRFQWKNLAKALLRTAIFVGNKASYSELNMSEN